MDDIDKAQHADAVSLADAIERQRMLAAKGPKVLPLGYCRNKMCGEPFEAGNETRLFCNAACADEHARRK